MTNILTSQENIVISELSDDKNTLPKNFLKQAQIQGSKTAMRKKRYGIWQEYSWQDCYQRVRDLCLGLVTMGLEAENKVCIIGENDPEFYWAQIAVWSVGAISTALFTDADLDELFYVLEHSDSVFLLAHDQEQCDKALELKDRLPKIKKVIYWEDRGLWNYDDPWLMPYEAVLELGQQYALEHPGLFEELISRGEPNNIAILSYTSGTTSQPKAAMISHRNLIFGNRHATAMEPNFPTDNFVSFSPLAWITEQSLGITGHLLHGFKVNFPEGPETVQTDIREIAPSHLLFPSRLWERIASLILVRINDSSWPNRVLYKLFMPIAYKIIDLEDAGKPIGWHWHFLRFLGDLLLFQPLRDKIGMTKMRTAWSSGSAISPDFIRFFRATGVQLKNLYGSTECQTHTLHYKGKINLSSVGVPPPGTEIKIADDGEIYVRSRSVFQGYYKNPEKYAEAVDDEGWFHTGDAGYINDDGHLYYLDRIKDMVKLAGGERFSPQYIEIRLKFSQYIEDAMAVGGSDKDYVTAIIIIDFNTVARWAEKNRITFTTFVDLSQQQEVYDLVRQDVERVNQTLPETTRIKKFVILYKTFDADEAELTRTRKLRRGVLEDKYGDMLAAMYTDANHVPVMTEVKYQDGRTGTVHTDVKICEL